MKYDSTFDTQSHIIQVRNLMFYAIHNLLLRSHDHDYSKLESPEKELFDQFTPLLRETTYGSPEYKQALESMGVALEHHYAENSHHPEHFGYAECNICFKHYPRDYGECCQACGNGMFTLRPDVSGMSLLDLIEMLADWKAAGMRHANGNLAESLKINKERFEISDQLFAIIENTAKELGWL